MKGFNSPSTFIALFVIAIFSATQAVAADSGNEQSGVILPPEKNQFQIFFNQNADGNFGERYSYKVMPTTENDPTRPLPHYQAILPACLKPADVTCIESIESKLITENVWTKGVLSTNQLDVSKLNRNFVQSYYEYGNWKADKLSGIPAGGVASSWDLPNTPHKDGVSYLAIVQFQSSFISDQSVFNPEVGFSELNGMIQPWSWACNAYCDFVGRVLKKNNATGIFPTNTEFRITIRTNFLGTKFGSWMVGRLEKPTIKFDSEKLYISGLPVTYPMGVSTLKSREECAKRIDLVMNKYYPRAPGTCNPPTSGFSTNSNDDVALALFDALDGDVVQNGQQELWTFSNARASKSIGACSDEKNFSLATSNAMLYSVNPPIWDKRSNTLSYRIASTHVDTEGNLNRGNYSLAISKKMADCLWNFDTKKASAEISITNSEGTQNIAVSAMRSSQDWIYFDASGFTFSAPEIKVKLINRAAKPLIKSITCVKGAISKKVSAAKPVCPTGYKVKKPTSR